jgi:pyruvate formate-lyase/glycerol dehydratase family glycyl radical enzyme
MNERVHKLRKTVGPGEYYICSEKCRLITESFKKTERQPEILRNAAAFVHVLDHIPIFIEDNELIVGNTASKPRGIEFGNLFGVWCDEEIDGLKEDEGFVVSSEDEAELRNLQTYWAGRTFSARMSQIFDDERLWPYVTLGVTLPPAPRNAQEFEKGSAIAGNGMGVSPEHGAILYGPDYRKVLYGGLTSIIEEAETELRNTRFSSEDAFEKIDFLRAVITANKAIIRFASRFADLATELAGKEQDVTRKKELEKIADTCRWVPAHPARSFYEAMQSFWFTYLMVNPNGTVSIGRFDQYMYPFYAKDIKEGRTTDEEVLELLELLRIKDMQIISTGCRAHRQKWSGLGKWHNMILGGQTPEGRDATNELTYLILEAAKDCQTPHHTLTIRVHERTPEKLMLKALEVVKTGIGMPAFIGDKGHIEFLLARGIPISAARDYILAGCLDINLTGNSLIVSEPMFIVPRVFDIFMHNGVDPKSGKQVGPETGELTEFQSFEDLLAAFKKQMIHFMEQHAEFNNIFHETFAELYPLPFASSLMSDSIKAGKDMLKRRLLFPNGSVMNAVGMINVADSLAAVKKLVFDEKKVTMAELKLCLDANWQGNGYGEMRKMFLGAPKYGNHDEYVDLVARDLYTFWCDTVNSLDALHGAKQVPSAISIAAQWPGGEETGATPDGRCRGDCLADGTMSAMRGMDRQGPTALILSAATIDQLPISTTLMNMKFHPTALNSPDDMHKVSDLIKTYFSLGGKHIQFNVVGREILRKAQEAPEEHRDLIVRVAGYSAYFVQLGKVIQNEIIGRTEYEKAI